MTMPGAGCTCAVYALLGILVGCGSPKPDSSTPVAAQNVDRCPQIAELLIHTFDTQHQHKLPPKLELAFREMVVERCTQDVWSQEVQACFVAPKADIDACTERLTKEQRETFQYHAQKLAEDPPDE